MKDNARTGKHDPVKSNALRQRFPFFNAPSCLYLDSAATTQKLASVLERQSEFALKYNASVHRGAYSLAKNATQAYEQVRAQLAKLIKAPKSDEIVFTSGATESLNTIASGITNDMLQGQTILICESEHHANILPWQALAKRLNLRIEVLKLDKNGTFSAQTQARWMAQINEDTAIIACAQISNVLGHEYPVRALCEKAKQCKALSVIDGTQALAHMPVDVGDIGCDFYVFSAHKMYGPTGVGVLWGKEGLLAQLSPSKLGGEMVQQVSFKDFTCLAAPAKFEAGTPNVLGVVAFGEAVDFLMQNMPAIQRQERALAQYLYDKLQSLKGDKIHILGLSESAHTQTTGKVLASFIVADIDNHALALALYEKGIALRFGQHCAMPLLHSLGYKACLRVSLACYNTKQDINDFIVALKEAINDVKAAPMASTDENKDFEALSLDNQPMKAQQGTAQLNQESDDDSEPSPHAFAWEQELAQAKQWSQKHRALLLLSKSLPVLEQEKRLDAHELYGCEARVWLAQVDGQLKAHAESKVIRGILAVLLLKHKALADTLKQSTPSNISDTPQGFDYSGYLNELGLSAFFSDSRRDGVHAVIQRIKSF